jgi:L-iditol 2-dehydrogenase
MKACVLHGIGDLRCESVDTPTPKPGEVRVKVGACGVCGSDIPRIFTKGTYHFPTIPGHEFAGIVDETGPGVDPALAGEPVAVFPLIPCRQCPPCEVGDYALCEDYDYLGSRSDGAFAEYVCAPEWNLIPVPEGVSLEEAAMVEPAAVAVHALRQGGVDVGDTVLIFGAGPIGLMLGQWAEASGAARAILADIDPRKLAFAEELGFSHVFNPKEVDPLAWVTERVGKAADLVIEASGSTAAFEQCLLAARTLGRVVLMGNPSGDMHLSQKAYWAILRKQLTLFGTWNSTYSDLPRNEWKLALDAMASGTLKVKPLVTHRVGLDGLWDALVMMRDGTEFSNKVMCLNA